MFIILLWRFFRLLLLANFINLFLYNSLCLGDKGHVVSLSSQKRSKYDILQGGGKKRTTNSNVKVPRDKYKLQSATFNNDVSFLILRM